jgi:hypothetical protein
MIRLPAQLSERFRHILVLEAPGLEVGQILQQSWKMLKDF